MKASLGALKQASGQLSEFVASSVMSALKSNVRSVSDGRGATKPAASGRADDPLLDCIGYVATQAGLPFSRVAARAGLPLGSGERLPPRLMARAAVQASFKAELVETRPSELPSLVTPFIAVLKEGGGVVVEALDKASGSASIVVPQVSDEARSITLEQLDDTTTGEVLLLSPNERADDKPHSEGLSWFWGSMARNWPAWTQAAIAALVINVLGLAVPIFVMNVYDRVIPNQSLPTLWALASGVALALLFEVVLKQLRAVVLDEASGLVDLSASSRLFRQALAIPMAERDQSPAAFATLVREFDTVREFFASASIVAFTDFLFIGLVIAVMYLLVGDLALVPLAALPVMIGSSLLLQWPMSRAVKSTSKQANRRHTVLIESLAAIETVKSATAEGAMQRRFEDAVAAHVRSTASSRFWSLLNINLIAFIQQAVAVVIVVWGVFLAAEGQITVGGIIAASMLSGRVLSPISNIALVLSRAQTAFAALRDLDALMAKPHENSGERAGADLADAGLEFRDVGFSYPGAALPALTGLTFKIASGERVGILGRVGSGKSTFAKLLNGLWQPSNGVILVGGREIRSLEASELRAHVGLLAQDIELFTGTVYDNIVAGCREASERDILAAASISGVGDFVRRHPDGLKMPVGERGRALSGGQRQAVALARTLIRKPRILVLDEPSSALDIASENEVVQQLRTWADETRATLIVNSQRMAMLDLCDRLIVFEQGRVIADGPKAEIMQMLATRPNAASQPPRPKQGGPS